MTRPNDFSSLVFSPNLFCLFGYSSFFLRFPSVQQLTPNESEGKARKNRWCNADSLSKQSSLSHSHGKICARKLNKSLVKITITKTIFRRRLESENKPSIHTYSLSFYHSHWPLPRENEFAFFRFFTVEISPSREMRSVWGKDLSIVDRGRVLCVCFFFEYFFRVCFAQNSDNFTVNSIKMTERRKSSAGWKMNVDDKGDNLQPFPPQKKNHITSIRCRYILEAIEGKKSNFGNAFSDVIGFSSVLRGAIFIKSATIPIRFGGVVVIESSRGLHHTNSGVRFSWWCDVYAIPVKHLFWTICSSSFEFNISLMFKIKSKA